MDTKEPPKEKQQKVDAFTVEGDEKGIDYDKLIRDFGCKPIDKKMVDRFEKITGQKPHLFLRRGVFISHRDLDEMLDHYENGKPFYLYTGRGPGSPEMHIGHLLPFMFTQWLQEVFKVPCVIQLTEDEKYFHKKFTTEKAKIPLEQFAKWGWEQMKDIIACGFDPDLTFIFSDLTYMGKMYPNVVKVQRQITYNQVRGIFGLKPEDNIGKVAYPAIQTVPAFSNTFPHIFGKRTDIYCLVPQGIDQDPYFRMTRDIAEKLDYKKTVCMHSIFFPALQGKQSKMSASMPDTCILLKDTAKQIKNKINKKAFSGGRTTKEDQRKYGANLEIDVPYNYLRFFLEDDDELEQIGEDYKAGKLLTSQVKARLIQVLQEVLGKHQTERAKVTDDVVRHFTSERRIILPGFDLEKQVEKVKQKKGKKKRKEGDPQQFFETIEGGSWMRLKYSETRAQKSNPLSNKQQKQMAQQQNANNQNTKKMKKQKQPKQPKKAQLTDWQCCDLRVGTFQKVWVHPNSQKCYCELVDMGNGEIREIASGVQQQVPLENMVGQCIVFTNLAPRPVGEFKSHGMVLFASTPDHSDLELIRPPKGSQNGERVFLEGETLLEESPPLCKKFSKIVKRSFKSFKTDSNCVCTWKGKTLMTSKGKVTVERLADKNIS